MALGGMLLSAASYIFMEINFMKADALIAKIQALQNQFSTLNKLSESAPEGQLSDYLDQLISITQKNEILLSELNNTIDFTSGYILLASLLVAVGIAISIIGFRFWYIRVQKPLDEIMQLNLAASRSEGTARIPFVKRIK